MFHSNDDSNSCDDIISSSTPLSHTWSPNNIFGFHVPPDHSMQESNGNNLYKSIFSIPCQLNDETQNEDINAHQIPPHTAGVVLEKNDTPQHDHAPSMGHPVPHTVVVDVKSGTIRVEVEKEENIETQIQNTPISNLTQSQQSWMIVFLRKWARKSGSKLRKAPSQHSPHVKRVANRSATTSKKSSTRGMSFFRKKSVTCNDEATGLNPKNRLLGNNAPRSSVKGLGRHVKQVTRVTARGVKKIIMVTSKAAEKKTEENPDSDRVSKQVLETSGRIKGNAKLLPKFSHVPSPSPTIQVTSRCEV